MLFLTRSGVTISNSEDTEKLPYLEFSTFPYG
jgi:hypothetical protein